MRETSRQRSPSQALIILLAITLSAASLTYIGQTPDGASATSPPVMTDYLETASKLDPRDGEAVIVVDTAKNVICVKVRHGNGGGTSCSPADATEPLLMESGGSATDPVHVVAVDPQRRLELLKAVTNGQVITATSQDGGFSIQLMLPVSAEELSVFDQQGNVLQVSHPSDTKERAHQAEEQLRNPGSRVQD